MFDNRFSMCLIDCELSGKMNWESFEFSRVNMWNVVNVRSWVIIISLGHLDQSKLSLQGELNRIILLWINVM